MASAVNSAFMNFERRAEGVDIQKLVETFVDVGPLFTLMQTTDHQVIHGRRGTGKTHALTYLYKYKRSAKDLTIYCDLRSVGSNTSVYGDHTKELSERATRLLIDVMTSIHDSICDFCIEYSAEYDLSTTGPILDSLCDSIGEIRVVGTTEKESSSTGSYKDSNNASIGVTASQSPQLSATFGGGSSREASDTQKQKVSGSQIYYVNFGSIMNAVKKIMSILEGVRIWIFLDEWSTVPIELQPYLADLIRRCLFPVRGITVKIGAIEQRTRFKIDLPQGSYIGLEIGADVASELNLDDFMVFENQPNRARDFYKQLFFKHFSAMDHKDPREIPTNADDLISRGFTQVNVFDEFVQAAEGVPRDAMNIISLAATRALDDKIGMKHIRDAARDWFQRGKERDLSANQQCINLLHYIVDEVIGKKSARAFLLKINIRDSLIDDLFDARVIHILKRNISGKDQPGERYDVYKIDYGCYVELISTAKSPKSLLGLDDLDDHVVPQDDYRAIRRAILDLNTFRDRGFEFSD